jgi:acetyltransferase-like isoleucine patch superfamily enzyme
MIQVKRIYYTAIQKLMSFESSISRPGSGSWFRHLCLLSMGVRVKSPVWIAENTLILNPRMLTLGKNVCIGESSKIICHGEIIIGDYFLSSCELTINSGSHDPETLTPFSAPVMIGNRVWCGLKVTICPGVTVGNDVVIGAGSLVNKDLPDGCIAYGVPAKPVRDLNRTSDQELFTPFNSKPIIQRMYKKLLKAVIGK